MQRLGVLLLAIYLILLGLVQLFGVSFPQSGLVLAVLALAAGILLLFDVRGAPRGRGRWRYPLGWLLLGIWLILTGLIGLTGLTFQGMPLLMALLALAAGVLILLQREYL